MAKLPTLQFVDYLERSGLVPEDVLKRTLDDLRREYGGKLPYDAGVVANRLIDARLITRWHADKILDRKYKGFFLGRYKLLNHLGTGTTSSVYLAEHELMKQKRAIKVLPPSRVMETSDLHRLLIEFQAVASCDHPNIVRAYDVDNDGDQHFIVMEFVDGRDLQQVVKQEGPLSLELACNYIAQAAEGMAYAHNLNLIHRAIKPTNLLIDYEGVVRILDLGLGSFLECALTSTNVAARENTLACADYLSPEQMLNSHGFDLRSDIYSLGCTLYFLLTGHPPFTDGSLAQRIAKHQTSMPEDIRKDRPDCPRDLADICVKMLRKDPKLRYQNMFQVSDALQTWLIHHGFRLESNRNTVAKKEPALGRFKISDNILASRIKNPQPAPSPKSPTFPLPSRRASLSRFFLVCFFVALLMAAILMRELWHGRRQ